MLVLGRKIGETILIGKDIEIIVTKIGKDKVGIGILAPKEISIIRKELLERGCTKLGSSV